MLATAENLRGHYWLATALWLNEMASAYAGDWQAARGFNQRGLMVSPSDTRLIGTRMVLEFETGNVVEGSRYQEELVEALRLATPGPRYDQGSAALKIPIVARITGGMDYLNIAEGAAAAVESAESATPFVSRLAGLGLALIAVLRGDLDAAREQYFSFGLAAGSYSFISGDRVLALLAGTMGELDLAVDHFEDALAFCRKAGFRPELAWTCHDYAEMLLASGDLKPASTSASTQERTKALLEEALTISEELGMPPLMARATALRERADVQPIQAPAYPDGLSQREVEVLGLIAAGKSNREIAEDLFISPNTVGHHVSNILNKAGCANRAELATYAARHDLVT